MIGMITAVGFSVKQGGAPGQFVGSKIDVLTVVLITMVDITVERLLPRNKVAIVQ